MLQQSPTAMRCEASVILLSVTNASRHTVSLSLKIIIDETVLLDGANLYLPSFPFGSILGKTSFKFTLEPSSIPSFLR